MTDYVQGLALEALDQIRAGGTVSPDRVEGLAVDVIDQRKRVQEQEREIEQLKRLNRELVDDARRDAAVMILSGLVSPGKVPRGVARLAVALADGLAEELNL